jgi:hypothetical protein
MRTFAIFASLATLLAMAFWFAAGDLRYNVYSSVSDERWYDESFSPLGKLLVSAVVGGGAAGVLLVARHAVMWLTRRTAS